jgi:hypothetical protein
VSIQNKKMQRDLEGVTMKTKRGIISVTVLAVLILSLLIPTAASAADFVFPASYYGTVKIVGTDAPVGTVVSAEILSPAGTVVASNCPVNTAGVFGGLDQSAGKVVVQTNNNTVIKPLKPSPLFRVIRNRCL